MTTFRDLLKKDGPVLGLFLHFANPVIVEFAKEAGFDFVRIDNEHQMFEHREIENIARVAALLDMPCHVRVSDLSCVAKLLDCGVTGIIVPDVNTPELAVKAVDAIKMYPLGNRGQFPSGRCVKYAGCSSFGEYVEKANDIVELTIQIESISALPLLDEIISTPGVDMVAVGRTDLAQSIGKPGRTKDPEIAAFEDQVISRTLALGKLPAIGVRSPEKLRELSARGIRVFACGPDEAILLDAMKKFVKDHKGL